MKYSNYFVLQQFFFIDMETWIWWLSEKTQKENTATLNMKYWPLISFSIVLLWMILFSFLGGGSGGMVQKQQGKSQRINMCWKQGSLRSLFI